MDDSPAVIAAREKAQENYRSGQFLCSEAVFLVTNECPRTHIDLPDQIAFKGIGKFLH